MLLPQSPPGKYKEKEVGASLVGEAQATHYLTFPHMSTKEAAFPLGRGLWLAAQETTKRTKVEQQDMALLPHLWCSREEGT